MSTEVACRSVRLSSEPGCLQQFQSADEIGTALRLCPACQDGVLPTFKYAAQFPTAALDEVLYAFASKAHHLIFSKFLFDVESFCIAASHRTEISSTSPKMCTRRPRELTRLLTGRRSLCQEPKPGSHAHFISLTVPRMHLRMTLGSRHRPAVNPSQTIHRSSRIKCQIATSATHHDAYQLSAPTSKPS